MDRLERLESAVPLAMSHEDYKRLYLESNDALQCNSQVRFN